MKFDTKALEELKELYYKHYGIELTMDAANSMAGKLLRIIQSIIN